MCFAVLQEAAHGWCLRLKGMLEGQSGHQPAVGGRTACQTPFGPRMEGVYTEASEDLASAVDM